MQKLNRRKFLQLCAVGAVAAARWLVTGGKKTENEGGYTVPDKYKEQLIGAIKGRKIYSTPEDTVMYTLGRSIHYNWNDDQELWRLKRRKSSWQGPLPPRFVILKPSEQMVKELEGLKAQSISILATYHD